MPLFYFSVAFVSGIIAAALIHLPLALWTLWLILPIISLFFWRNSFHRMASLCAFAFLLGAIRFSFALAPPNEHSLASFNDHGDLRMHGEVIEPPDVRDRSTNLHVSISTVQLEQGWQDITGLALVEVPRETDVRYGDVIEFLGEPRTPFETQDFSYKDYLSRQGIYTLIRAYEVLVIARGQGNAFYHALYSFRDRAFATIKNIFPEPAASLLAGILLGIDSGISRNLHDAFAATNTLHVIAISGFNISIIAGILSRFAQHLFSPALATLIVIVGLVIYTLFVGATPSVIRAAVMGSLSILALYFHRQNDALNALAIAALIMCAIDPYTLYDLGFQLSFFATLGLVLYVERLKKWFEKLVTVAQNSAGSHSTENESGNSQPDEINNLRAKKIVSLFSDSLIVTLAAQITTTPLILFTFHRLSIIGFFTNLLILPMQPPLMVWGGFATIAGMIFQPLGQVLAWIAWVFLEWTIIIVQATARVPFASIDTGRLDVVLIVLSYVALFGASHTNLIGIRNHITFRPALALGAVIVAGVLIWNAYITAPDGRTRVVFIDANSAATFVQTPAGNKILIDGGANPSAVLSEIGQRMPFWDHQIDLVVLTNADEAYLAGLVEVLARYEIKQIVEVRAPAKTSAAYLKWRDLIAQKRVLTLQVQSGLYMDLDRDVTLEFLHPFDDAASSTAVARLRVGSITFLFAEAATMRDQSALAAYAEIESSVLIAPKKITSEFFTAVNPQFTVVFAGQSGRDKPSADLLSILSQGILLQTNEHGTVEIIVERQGIRVKTTR